MQNFQVGDLLVASSSVQGTVLQQSVCLLVYEDDENAVGLLLNRPLRAVQPGAAPTGKHPDPTGKHPDQPAANRLPKMEPADPATADTPPAAATTIAIGAPDHDAFAGQLIRGSALHFGGPLAGPVVAIHGNQKWAEASAGEGVFVAAQREHLEALMHGDSQAFRLIVGHLGWTHAELGDEISEGLWHRLPATADLLTTADDQLWPMLIRRATSHSVARWIGTPDAAERAELN